NATEQDIARAGEDKCPARAGRLRQEDAAKGKGAAPGNTVRERAIGPAVSKGAAESDVVRALNRYRVADRGGICDRVGAAQINGGGDGCAIKLQRARAERRFVADDNETGIVERGGATVGIGAVKGQRPGGVVNKAACGACTQGRV